MNPKLTELLDVLEGPPGWRADVEVLLQAQLDEAVQSTAIAQTKRLRNLIKQQGPGSWQRVFEGELAALTTQSKHTKENE